MTVLVHFSGLRICISERLATVMVKKKAWEILSEDVPIHVMDLPQMKRAKDVKAWAEEIKELMHVVEEFTGNKVTAEKLAESIKPD